jgi:hypothetical protein
MYTGFYLQNSHIFGPEGYTGYYFAQEHIYGPNGYTEYYRSGDHIFGPTGYTQCFFCGDHIYGRKEELPWVRQGWCARLSGHTATVGALDAYDEVGPETWSLLNLKADCGSA